MDAVFLTLLVVTIANLALAGFVLWHRPGARVNRIFALTALSTAGWTFTNAIFQYTTSLQIATLTAQFSYLSAVVLGASFLHFAWVFPLQRPVSTHVKRLLWSSALLIGLLPFVPGAVIRTISLSGNRSIDTTPGLYLIALFMLGTSAWAFGTFLKHHSTLRAGAREQSRYVLAGSALTAVTGLVCNLLLPLLHNYSLVWLGPASSIFFVSFIVYAIIAHRLFDIRLIIKKTLLYSLLLAAIGAAYGIVEHTLTEAFRQATQNSDYSWLINIVGALLVSFAIAPVRHWLEKQLDRIFFPIAANHTGRNAHPIQIVCEYSS
jgi:hypothetical protein